MYWQFLTLGSCLTFIYNYISVLLGLLIGLMRGEVGRD